MPLARRLPPPTAAQQARQDAAQLKRKYKFDRCTVSGCEKTHYGRGYCKAHHQWHWNHGLIAPAHETMREKLERQIIIDSETGCWLWQGSLNNNGYGVTNVGNQKPCYAHRAAYEAFREPIPLGLSVCHKCDNPRCCNPEHLFVGTHKENMEDAARKGRIRNKPVCGIEHPRAVLTAEQVAIARSRTRRFSELAALWGVHAFTISRAAHRLTYRDIP